MRDEVKVIRRFVEEQNIRVGGERARQRCAPRFSPRRLAGVGVLSHAELRHQSFRHVLLALVVKLGQDVVEHRDKAGKVGLLRQVPEAASGWTKRSPWSAAIKPAAIRSRVDFPEPLRPTMAIRSPSEMPSSARSKSGLPPIVRLTSRSCNIGGIGSTLAKNLRAKP